MMLSDDLTRLEQADLIRRVGHTADWVYWFKHGLVQETAYDSLLKQDRKRLHWFVARSLQDASDSAAENSALILAKHWDEAGEPARALACYLRAGENAARVYAHAEALEAFDRARVLTRHLAPDAKILGDLYQKRGRVMELRGEYQMALENYAEWEQLARTRGDTSLELQAVIRQIILFTTPNSLTDLPRAIEHAQRALAAARALDDRPAQAQVLWTLLLAEHFSGNTAQAVEFGEQSLALARELDLREQIAYTLNDLARPYAMQQRMDDAQQVNREAQTLWRELGNLPMLADNLTNAGMGAFFTGDYESAFPMIHQALQLSQDTSNVWGQAFASEVLGMMYYPLGDWQNALECLHEAARLGRKVNFVDPDFTGLTFAALIYRALDAHETGVALMETIMALPAPVPAWHSGPMAMLAMLHAERGELTRARAMLDRAQCIFQGVTDSPAPFLVAFAEIVVRLALNETDSALTASTALLPFVEQIGIRPYIGSALYLHARVLEQRGEWHAVRDTLEHAYQQASAVQTRAILWEIAAAGARVESQLGNLARAHVWRTRGRAAAQFIVAHAPEQFRSGFLNRPDVRDLMENNGKKSSSPMRA